MEEVALRGHLHHSQAGEDEANLRALLNLRNSSAQNRPPLRGAPSPQPPTRRHTYRSSLRRLDFPDTGFPTSSHGRGQEFSECSSDVRDAQAKSPLGL